MEQRHSPILCQIKILAKQSKQKSDRPFYEDSAQF